jgi:hypothetical protein
MFGDNQIAIAISKTGDYDAHLKGTSGIEENEEEDDD